MRTALSITLLCAAALAGCNATPLEYHSPQDIPRGAGMFSGNDGGYTMRYAKDAKKAPAAAPAPNSAAALSAEEYREFQEWREWRRAREEAGKK